jgi:hypothetical protein
MALAEWVEKTSTSNFMLIYGGFSSSWAAGKLERQIVDGIVDKYQKSNLEKKIFFAVTSWHDPKDILDEACKYRPDLVILFSLTDPIGPSESLVVQYPCPVNIVGYSNDTNNFIDFWAIACLKFFRIYTIEDLVPKTLISHVFLNYNRKPHRHRQFLVQELENNNLNKCGIITLGNSQYTLNEHNKDYEKYGALDVVGDIKIPNDIYSLGNMNVWNSCFLNIVSETEYEYNKNIFVSEKIYKPIIGLRPFIVNGSPGIYKLLKNAGFDCFEDIFDIDKLSDVTRSAPFPTHSTIVDTIRKLQNENLNQLYKQLLPRLLYNRNLFFKYAKHQQSNLLSKFSV